MDTLRIHRMTTRYRLPASARDERGRLDRVLQQALDEMLEAALERAGVPTHEEICLRELKAPVRLRLAATDAALAVDWSLALAESIRAAIAAGGSGVVRYGSRHHALVDVALGAARGELSRAWAWQQLGLWRPTGSVGSAEAVREAARALSAEPRAIVPVLSELARAGALPRFVELARGEGCTALARAALIHFNAPAALAVRAPAGESPRPPLPALERRTGRVLGASAIARAAVLHGASDPSPEDAGELRALAILSVLESEPTAFRQGVQAGAALVLEVERRLRASPAEAPPSARREPGPAPHVPGASKPPGAEAGPGVDVRLPAESRPEAPGPRAPAPSPGEEGRPHAEDRTGALAPLARPKVAGPPASPEEEEGSAVPDVRRRGSTRAAGLLFLLHLVDELGLTDALLAGEPGAARGLRWMLHQLALTLLPLEPRDPAALAFAGLGPETEPPSEGEPPPTGAEQAVLEDCAARVAARLGERLDRPGEPRDKLLLSVCRRRGEVVADPGWIELRLELDEVSTEVRRAGLDLDPDWLPWLGVVVRFVYA